MLLLARVAAGDCVPFTAGQDTVGWNDGGTIFNGSAIGQTFLAVDTIISRITVWRPPNNHSLPGAHIWIVDVDTTQVPPRPNTGAILLNGPNVDVYDSDPPGQLIEMPFVLDPPLVLPRRGIFAFFVQGEDCYTGAFWSLIGRTGNAYPYGVFWNSPRVTSAPCRLRPVDDWRDDLDLAFEIEYCHSATTPVLKRTWGRIKTIYR